MEEKSAKPWYRSWVWLPIMALVIGTFIYASAALLDAKAWGVTPERASVPTACVDREQLPCKQSPAKYVKKFKAGKYGNSAGVEFAPYVKKMIKKWYRDHPGAARQARSSDWWKWPWESAMCSPSFGPGYKVACAKGAKDFKVWQKGVNEVNKVAVICSGSAILGTLKGGGEVGAGIAATGCLWSTVTALW